MHPTFSLRLVTLLGLPFTLAATQIAVAQSSDSIRPPAAATVSGLVTDSMSGAALAGAVVQLVPAEGFAHSARIAYSDWLGRYWFRDVPAGRYTLGLFHPLLDSLGVDAPMREVIVAGRDAIEADLATPSPARLRAAVCGSGDSGGLVVGVVRAASDGSPVEAAKVAAEWVELSLTTRRVVRHVARLVATTGPNGWFALCNVPAAGTLSLIATHDADSTGLIEVNVPANSVVRRELYIGTVARETGATAALTSGASNPLPDSASGPALAGRVVTADTGRPLAGAEVNLSPGVRTRTNERGEWSLIKAPPGTQMLEVRAVGYSPERRAVDVTRGAPPVVVALSTLNATLDAVRVSENARLHTADLAAFRERRRTGAGRYLTAEDIEMRGDLFTSEIFRSLPGIRLGYAHDTLPPDKARPPLVSDVDRLILMRSTAGLWCLPAIYVNGALYPGVSAGDLNSLLTTRDLAGIEVYSPASVPAQFQRTMTGCGSIVIWRK